MRSINSKFYKSTAWQKCREAYLLQHPFCEECLKRGEYTPAKHVHHRIWLNQYNKDNPEFTLNFKNLEAVCQECHNRIHAGTENIAKRYTIDSEGRVMIK